MLSDWEFEDTIERLVDAPPETATDGVRHATFRDVPLASGIGPAARHSPVPAPPPAAVPGSLVLRRPASQLRASSSCLVTSARWWPATSDDRGPHRAAAAGFAQASSRRSTSPGYAKVVTDFVAVPEGARTRLRDDDPDPAHGRALAARLPPRTGWSCIPAASRFAGAGWPARSAGRLRA